MKSVTKIDLYFSSKLNVFKNNWFYDNRTIFNITEACMPITYLMTVNLSRLGGFALRPIILLISTSKLGQGHFDLPKSNLVNMAR